MVYEWVLILLLVVVVCVVCIVQIMRKMTARMENIESLLGEILMQLRQGSAQVSAHPAADQRPAAVVASDIVPQDEEIVAVITAAIAAYEQSEDQQ